MTQDERAIRGLLDEFIRALHASGLRLWVATHDRNQIDGEEVELWFRVTACFRRDEGQWRITHMHNSVPFAMDGSAKALIDLKP
jgi:ketosteroid isomerase-like protein